ncbi:hypothetical protein QFW96_02185 [Saccharopolyspora sp. TS4A08]|uniref:DUF4760 domain-containing protein n=1 Tax=Saccharopolyspora ipomoeae TaxID=3042027 RepID=A0ABT6PHC0_9PSEU|nr:hypothetical protein [Saccharopolyspora sp. TS4A08]MDI2027396.1 hypothetical protein [Saccharopolyspora sp. TS4A08]
MPIPVPAQTALISAFTAGIITLVIEYAAKPRLEARKDRIVEHQRAHREMLSRLLGLTKDLMPVITLSFPGPGWEMAKAALDANREQCNQLYNEFVKFQESLGKRQQKTVATLLLSVPTRVKTLDFIVFMYESSGIIDEEKKRLGPGEKLPMAPTIEGLVYAMIEDIAAAYTALQLSRARPWSYHFRLRHLIRRHEEVQQGLLGHQPPTVNDQAAASS